MTLRVEDVELVALWGFDERVESLAIDLLAVGMSGYVAHEQVSSLGAGEAITVIRAVGDQRDEVLLQDLSAVRSTNDARDAVTLHIERGAALVCDGDVVTAQ